MADGSITRDIPAGDHPVEYSGGALALDFTNTIGGSIARPTHDHLRAYEDLCAFLRGAQALSSAGLRELRAGGAAHPLKAAEVLEAARTLRRAIWDTFAAIAREKAPPADALGLVRAVATEAYAHADLAKGASAFEWRPDATDLRAVLWPIALSAVDLLRDADTLAQVRQCASQTCSWLFIDRSRNHSRRWCDMSDCGNRAKVQRFRARAKRAKGRGRS